MGTHSRAVSTIDELQSAIAAFNQSRGWGSTHSPSALSAALSIEASELAACFLWKEPHEQLDELNTPEMRTAVADEVGDIAIYLLMFCDRFGFDLARCVREKLAKNDKRFPRA
jgi:NTP pyrophosphatase (non-canonical NTP hydrolase)